MTGLQSPVAFVQDPTDRSLQLVVQQAGRIRVVRDGAIAGNDFLNLTSSVSCCGEQGLLGLAFAPDYASSGRFYVNFTNTAGNTVVARFLRSSVPAQADPSTRFDLQLEGTRRFVTQPFANHNGGHLAFGPDGYLYIGLGDGGSGGDPQGNGQSLSTLLGKILRIAPRPSGDRPYTIPTNNPFVGVGDARAEIWAYGLRNPWRFSFDRVTGDLWIGDVGQSAWEEVDLQPADPRGGENYGWNVMEGNHPYGGASPSKKMVPPVYEYPHADGRCVVTGGYVYRGRSIPALAGAYVFGDFCDGRLEAIRVTDGHVVDHAFLGPVVNALSSFGEDASGEQYALSLSGGLYMLAPSDA